jgi:hypothetical protein
VQNRELQIMKQLKHSNVVELKCSFYSKGEKVSFLPTAREINSITACVKGAAPCKRGSQGHFAIATVIARCPWQLLFLQLNAVPAACQMVSAIFLITKL